jgi:hypothetical protein
LCKDSDRVADVSAEIRTEHLPNACIEGYRYDNPPNQSYRTPRDDMKWVMIGKGKTVTHKLRMACEF